MYWITNELCHQLLTPDSDSLFINLPNTWGVKNLDSYHPYLTVAVSRQNELRLLRGLLLQVRQRRPEAALHRHVCRHRLRHRVGRRRRHRGSHPRTRSRSRRFWGSFGLYLCAVPRYWSTKIDFQIVVQLISGLVCLPIRCTTNKKSTSVLQNPGSVYVPRARTARGSTRRCFDSVHPMSLT